VNSNAHGLGDPKSRNTDVAFGMFPLTALFFNHSCDPNCTFIGAGGRVQVRTLRPVSADEELHVSYVDLFSSRDERRSNLLQTKHFWCKCKRCTTPIEKSVDRFIEGILCDACKHDVYFIEPAKQPEQLTLSVVNKLHDTQDFKCSRCQHTSKGADLKKKVISIIELYNKGRSFIQEKEYQKARQAFEELLKQADGNFHEFNSLILNSMIPLMNVVNYQEDFKNSVLLNRSIIKKMETSGAMPVNAPEVSTNVLLLSTHSYLTYFFLNRFQTFIGILGNY
jgi:SET and MYND domain-containing protein